MTFMMILASIVRLPNLLYHCSQGINEDKEVNFMYRIRLWNAAAKYNEKIFLMRTFF
jgi:hypothetical protein